MSNKETRLTEKQKMILEVATELFAEKGFSSTSTSEIAEKANVAEGTIFKHFKSKKGLLMAVTSPLMMNYYAPIIKNDLYKVFDQKFEHFPDFIRALIENRKHFILNNLPVLRILVQEIPFHPELKEQFIEQIGKEIVEKIRGIIKFYQDKGQIADLHVDTIMRTVASTILTYIVARYVVLPEAGWESEEIETERIVQLLEQGISKK